ncbi:MAG: hypothetical protein IJN87_07050, partial [Firmicutes bacterium]|nr:hypothetical protein [Bacillota bacterium]
MKNQLKKCIIGILVVCMLLTSCRSVQVREEKQEEKLTVEIYDVIPVPEDAEAYGEYQYEFHTVRHGMAYTIGAEVDKHASFHTIIDGLSYRSGVDIEYFIFGSWEELRKSLENAQSDGATKIILYNNSYDESLIKEVVSGNYMDLAQRFKEEGIYDDENYQQAVLAAGNIDGRQLLVPILYNVYGMVGATNDYKPAEPTYTEFLQMLQAAMNTGHNYAQLSSISTAILEGRDPDLFWYAAGEDWYDYENQEELFTLLQQYLTKYWDEAVNEMKLKDTWAEIIKREDQEMQQFQVISGEADAILLSSELEALNAEDEERENSMWRIMLSQVAYIVEAGGSEENAYHSVMGLINWSMSQKGGVLWKYTAASTAGQNDFGYWPIQMLSREGYAAQPTCYAAVLGDGNEEAAFRVIQELMKQPFALQFGFSTYTPAWREKFDAWCRTGNMQATGYSRNMGTGLSSSEWEETQGIAIYRPYVYSSGSPFNIETIDDIEALLDRQLANITFAQIADAEVQSLWQDTLEESVRSGLSPEAGFELLCKRMEEWERVDQSAETDNSEIQDREKTIEELAESSPHFKEFLERQAAKEKEQKDKIAADRRPWVILIGVIAIIGIFMVARKVIREKAKRSGKEKHARIQIAAIDKSNGEAERNVR